MLCDACLKISPSLEPVRQGTLKYENPWPSLVENLDKDSQDPLSRLLRASLAESNLDREIPNSQILVPGDLDMELQPSLDDLRKSADLGCEGCLFWLELVPEDIQDRLDVGVRIKAPSEPFFRTKIDPRDWSVGRLSFIGPNLESTNTDDDKIVDLATRSLEICVAEDDPAVADDRILFRTIARDFNQPQFWANLKSWLKECTSSHECGANQDSLAPTRLLDLNPESDQNHIQLHDTEETFNEPYIALSYCWGTAGFFKTTSKNIDDLRNSIELESMPVVIQDAVKVARELNIRYLWIDALCIIQDSTEDWAKELLKMGKIYQNAYLTIVASSSTGVTESFLRERPVVSSLKLSFQSPNMKAPGFINLRHYSNHPSVQNNPGLPDISRVSRDHWQQPIHDRAWTLQERFMSTRVVFFDPTQLLFECRCTRRFEGFIENVDLEGRDYPGQLSTGRRGNDNFADNLSKSRLQSAWTRETVYNPNPLMYADKYAQVEFNEHWNRVLIDFGLRHLTYSSDALFALSAVAKKFGADLGDIYLAGIWMNDFRKGLLWNMRWSQESPSPRVAPYMSSILEALPEHQRAIASSGPSWSWVSRFTQPDKINFSVVASQKPLHDERDVQLVEYFAIPLFDNDMFGPLKIGMLTLKGYMARVDVIFSYASPGPEFGGVLLLRAKTVLADQSTAKIKCCFDSIPEMVPVGFRPEDGAVADPFSLQALIISGFSVNRLKYKYSSGKRPIYYGLLLKPTPFVSANGEFVYQRVGVFSLDPEITEETFEDFIGFDVFTPTTETWTGWAERQIDII